MRAQKRVNNSVKGMAQNEVENPSTGASRSYASFDRIDGTHSFKDAVPDGYVDYQVRTRHGGAVFYFNFDLAREMGLLASDHPDELTSELKKKVLETFSLVIINEYDIEHAVPIRPQDIRPNRYMATRYLQLQHPNKQGKTSGDGRGIWNGEWTHRGKTWDVSSSGTGATRLSPAHAQTKKFFKTGDRVVGYGNGYNCVNEGLSAALMSEVFHRNGIETERTLAIIAFEGGSSINVRASKNLLRPAHFFCHLKQGNYRSLKAAVDYFIDRQVKNGDWKQSVSGRRARYRGFAEQMALTFSTIAARYESEYIFCWLDWDGDNILANGGIIDYGSVRQFGLFHHEYRYDDVDRMSTNIPEQRVKARYIVQNFAQLADYLIRGRKRPIKHFRNDPALKLFDRNFQKVLHSLLLSKLGFGEKETEYLIQNHPGLVLRFKKIHSYFEKAKSSRGTYQIEDGITCDAIFCMGDLHRKLSQEYFRQVTENGTASPHVPARDFIEMMKSSYAKHHDLRLNRGRRERVKEFQRLYFKMIRVSAKRFRSGDLKKAFWSLSMRASVKNPENRLTGDGVLSVTSSLIRNQKTLDFEQRQQVILHLVEFQTSQTPPEVNPESKTGKVVLRNLKAIRNCREGF